MTRFLHINLAVLLALSGKIAVAQTVEGEAPEILQVDEGTNEGEGEGETTQGVSDGDQATQLTDEMNKLLFDASKDPSLLAAGSAGEATLIRLAEREGSPHAAYNLGVLQLKSGNLAKARFYFQMTLDKDTQFADALAQLGLLAIREGRREEGEQQIERALVMDEYCAVARDHMALKSLNNGDYDEAIQHCRIALLGDPGNMNAYLNMAIAWLKLGKSDVASLVCKSALAIDRDNASILNVMGMIQMNKGDIRGAFALFERARKADPAFLDATKNLAAMAMNHKDFAAALSSIDAVLAVEPGNLEFRVSRAVALRGLGRHQEARTVLDTLVKDHPAHREALYNLCVLLTDYMSQYDDGLRVCTRFRDTLDSRHPKWKEMEVKVRGIQETIRVMKDTRPPVVPEEAPSDDNKVPEGGAEQSGAKEGGEGPPSEEQQQ